MIKKVLLGFVALTSSLTYAQVNLETKPETGNVTTGSAFLDASSYYYEGVSGTNNVGKGLVFPQVDLVEFEFNIDLIDGATILPTYYDGMIVYNKSTGVTKTEGEKRSSTATSITPGFYYFSNPNGEESNKVRGGRWVRIGEDAVTRIDTTERIVKVVDGKSVYAKTGDFTLSSGGSNHITITFPSGMVSMHSITIYRKENNGNDRLVGSSVYSYSTEASNRGKIVFGSGNISMSYPEGQYSYILEYTK